MSQSEYWNEVMRKRLSRRRLLRAGFTAGAGIWAGSIIGCESGQKAAPTATTAAKTTANTSVPTGATAAATAAPQPKSGGKLVIRSQFEPRGFDPSFETTPYGTVYITNTHNNVVKFNRAATKIVPDLAASWEQPDPVTYIFKLNQGVKYQNVAPANGREFTAEDVKFSIERQITDQPGKFNHAYFFLGELAKIEVVDKYTVKFVTNQPYAPFMNYMANPWTVMICREVLEKHGDLSQVSIGTGPYIFKEYNKGVEGVMVKNPDYFKKGKPYLDEVRVRYVADDSTTAAMFMGKELDITALYFSDVDRVKKTRTEAQYRDVPSMFPFILRTAPYDDKRPHRAPYNDRKVRQAIQYATNKQEYLDVVYGGKGIQFVGMISPALNEWALPQSAMIKQDLAKAKQLMAEAGLASGFKTELICSNSPTTVDSSTVAKGQLAKIGIEVDIKPIEVAQYYNKVYSFDYPLNIHNMLGNTEPEDYLKPYYGAKATYYRWGNLEIQKKIEEQTRTLDVPKRKQLILEIEKMLQEDAPMVPLFAVTVTTALQARVQGYDPAWNQYDYSHYEDVWVNA